jgi:UDP-glucose 4-epimerase
MKLVITGGTGFIGKWFLRTYGSQFDCSIVGIENFHEFEVDGFKFPFTHSGFTIEELTTVVSGADAVLHMAAKRYEVSQSMNYYMENIEISANLFEACRIANVKNLVHLSTIGVYGQADERPWREDDDANPETFYGITKLCVEKLAHIHNRKYGIKIKNLRLAQVVGSDERAGFILSVFIERARNHQPLLLWGKGDGRREYIYIRDVVNAIKCALERPDVSGVFNIGTGVNVSHRELAEMVNRAFDNNDNIELLSNKPEDKSIHLMDIQKAELELDWRAKWKLDEAFQEIKASVAD